MQRFILSIDPSPRQTIDDGRKAAITAMCTSMDGEWIFTTIGNGMVTVYKRGKARKTEKGKRRKQGA